MLGEGAFLKLKSSLKLWFATYNHFWRQTNFANFQKWRINFAKWAGFFCENVLLVRELFTKNSPKNSLKCCNPPKNALQWCTYRWLNIVLKLKVHFMLFRRFLRKMFCLFANYSRTNFAKNSSKCFNSPKETLWKWCNYQYMYVYCTQGVH